MKNRLAALLALTIVALLMPPGHAAAATTVTVTGTVVIPGGEAVAGTVHFGNVFWDENGEQQFDSVASAEISHGTYQVTIEPGYYTADFSVTLDDNVNPGYVGFRDNVNLVNGATPSSRAPVTSLSLNTVDGDGSPVDADVLYMCYDPSPGYYSPYMGGSVSGTGSGSLTVPVLENSYCELRVIWGDGLSITESISTQDRPETRSLVLESFTVSGRAPGPVYSPGSTSISSGTSTTSVEGGRYSFSVPAGRQVISYRTESSEDPGGEYIEYYRVDLQQDTELDFNEDPTVPFTLHVNDGTGPVEVRANLRCDRNGYFSSTWEDVGSDVQLIGVPLPADHTCQLYVYNVDRTREILTGQLVVPASGNGEATAYLDSGAIIHGDPATAVDADGVDAVTESFGDWSGDNNRDGIYDYRQDNVTSLPTFGAPAQKYAPYVAVAGPAGSALADVSSINPATLPTAPPEGVSLPDGLLSFTLQDIPVGSTQSVEIWSSNARLFTDYAKYDVDDDAWSLLPRSRVTQHVDRLVVQLTDGGIGDADGIANGRIVDPGGPARVTTPPDTTPPEVTGTTTSDPNSNGWYDDDVTVTWNATDNQSSVEDPPDTVLTDEGEDLTATSEEVCDAAGNCATGTLEGIDIDRTSPSVQLTGPADGSTYVVGAVPGAGCTASDVLSGLASPCTTTTTGGLGNGVGSFVSTATATDRAGHPAQASAAYDVHYRFDGFQQPINDPRTSPSAPVSVFRAGDTIPVSFTLRRNNGTVITPADAPRWVTPVRGNATSARVNENVASGKASTGSTFSWRKDHWQFDWSTKKLPVGYEYRIGARLDDGTTRYVTVALR